MQMDIAPPMNYAPVADCMRGLGCTVLAYTPSKSVSPWRAWGGFTDAAGRNLLSGYAAYIQLQQVRQCLAQAV